MISRSKFGLRRDLALARSVRDALDGHGGHGPLPGRERGEDGGPGGGRQLHRNLTSVGHESGEQGCGARRRDRHGPVRAFHEAAAKIQRRDANRIQAEPAHPPDGADDIGDGIQGAHLMEVDLFDGGTMSRGFRFGQPLKDANRVALDLGRENRGFDDLCDVREVPVRVALFRGCDAHERPTKRASLDRLRRELDSGNAQAGNGGLQRVKRQPRHPPMLPRSCRRWLR